LISSNEYLLSVPEVGSYYACNGDTIIVEPVKNVKQSALRLFLLSNAMGAILHQRGSIPFHGSGIIIKNKAVLFTGPSGIGKSTLLLGLIQKGYQIFTDDVCVFSENKNSGKIEVTASYPMMKLWENSIDTLAEDSLTKDYQLRPNIAKFGIFQHGTFSTASIPIHKIYVLKADTSITLPCIEKLNPLEAFSEMQANTYRREYVDYMKLQRLHFDIVSKLTHQAEVFRVEKNRTTKIQDFIEFMEAHI
jgi:GTPase SAR1 family protein